MIELFTDASTRGNPGESAIGVFYKGEGHKEMYAKKIGFHTNHEAEFIALLEGIKMVVPLKPAILSIKVDSKIVFQAVDRNYVKNSGFKVLLGQITELLDQVPVYFIKWIPDKENAAAHRLASEELRRED